MGMTVFSIVFDIVLLILLSLVWIKLKDLEEKIDEQKEFTGDVLDHARRVIENDAELAQMYWHLKGIVESLEEHEDDVK